MKAVFLTQSISRRNGGVSEVARRLAQTVARQPETAVEVISLRDPDTEADLPGWSPIVPRILDAARPGSLGYSPRTARTLNALEADLAHVHGLWTHLSPATRNWARRQRKPYLISPHGMLDPWALRNSGWKKKLAGSLYENSAQREAACFHAMTEAEILAIRQHGLRNPVCLIPNGVDLPADGPPGPAPWEGQVPKDRPVLLYLGRLHPKKGLPALLKAWTNLRPEWDLVIAGWDQGGHEAELRRQASEAGLEGKVHFPGPLFGEAKSAAYFHADAFVLPSLSEGLPLVVLEAWAHRTPVLITAECNLPQGFTEGAASPMEGDFGASLEHFFKLSESDRRSMGARGRRLVEERFSWDKIGKEMHAVYQWLLGRGPRPVCVRY